MEPITELTVIIFGILKLKEGAHGIFQKSGTENIGIESCAKGFTSGGMGVHNASIVDQNI
jgi:hypothetical protein